MAESSIPGEGQPQPLDVVRIDTSQIKLEEADLHSPEDRYLEATAWSLTSRWEKPSELRQYISRADHLLHSRVNFVRQGYLMQLPFEERHTLELREVNRFEVFLARRESGSIRYLSNAQYACSGEAVTLAVTDVRLRDKMNKGLTGELGPGFVCLSLALPLEDQEGAQDASKRYKLVASWIPLTG